MYLKLLLRIEVDSSNLLGNNCTDVTKSNVVLTKSLLFIVGFCCINHNDYAYKKLISQLEKIELFVR